MPVVVHPFLMFERKAEEAMTLYTSLFPDRFGVSWQLNLP